MTERDDQHTPEPAADDEDDLVDEELLAEFLAEWDDHIRVCEQALLELESDPEDRPSLDAVFRAFHSIKGAAGFLGQDALRDLAHRAENLFDRARRREVRITGTAADVALAALDAVRWYVAHLRGESDAAGGAPPGLEALLEALDDPSQWSGDAVAESGVSVAPRQGGGTDPGAASHRAAAAADASPDSSPAPTAAGAGAALPNRSGDEGSSAPATRAGAGASAAAPAARAVEDETIRVRVGRLDTLVNRVGELVLAHSMLSQHAHGNGSGDPVVQQGLELLGRVSRELQDLAMAMRMVPLDATFTRMRRLVRDVSRRLGRRVEFVVRGADTEIDRGVVQLVVDPLVHVLRNAVDHGIEPPDERRAAGKPETGRIVLEACHADGDVVITVSDDGRGIDPMHVLEKARERGLVPEGRALSRAEILELLFAPGFSTAETVTEVSGRGVGMDVVRRNIEAAHGRISMTSEPGRGSTVTLRIPLTLAIVDGMVVRVGSERYVVPTHSIERVVQPGQADVRAVPGRGEVLQVGDELLPLVRLHEVLGVRDARTDASRAVAVVAGSSHGRSALLVDALVGKHEVVIKPLGRRLPRAQGVAGATILSDGRVGLILDPEGIRRDWLRARPGRNRDVTHGASAGSNDAAAPGEPAEPPAGTRDPIEEVTVS